VAGPGRVTGQLVFVFDGDGFEVLGFEYLAAVKAFDVVDAVSTGDHLGGLMLTIGRHSIFRIATIFENPQRCVKGGWSTGREDRRVRS
jgi:hypothetical protein